jgi:RNA polymerase sigma-70 factor, ECF subfamily
MRSAVAGRFGQLDGCDDRMLVELARNGSEAAVAAIIKRHNRRLYRVARAILRDDADAEDVVQETYVRAFAALASFRGDSVLSTWLTRIALNEALGRVRRHRPTTGIEEIEGEEHKATLIMFPSSHPISNPETEMARNQVRQILEQAINDLPEPFRLVFVLREVEGMNVEETAALINVKPETVKTRLHRARRLMRTALEKKLSPAFSELFPFDGVRCDRIGARVIRRLKDNGIV